MNRLVMLLSDIFNGLILLFLTAKEQIARRVITGPEVANTIALSQK
jgi:hypothetical protein